MLEITRMEVKQQIKMQLKNCVCVITYKKNTIQIYKVCQILLTWHINKCTFLFSMSKPWWSINYGDSYKRLRKEYHINRFTHALGPWKIRSIPWGEGRILIFCNGQVLTSIKGAKTLSANYAVRRVKLGIYTLQNPPEKFWMLAPPGGYKECAVVFWPIWRGCFHSFKTCEQKRF